MSAAHKAIVRATLVTPRPASPVFDEIERRVQEAVCADLDKMWIGESLAHPPRRAKPHVFPAPLHKVGDEFRAGGDVVCATCKRLYYDHPLDPNILGFDGPFLNVLCSGARVKL